MVNLIFCGIICLVVCRVSFWVVDIEVGEVCVKISWLEFEVDIDFNLVIIKFWLVFMEEGVEVVIRVVFVDELMMVGRVIVVCDESIVCWLVGEVIICIGVIGGDRGEDIWWL